MAGGEVDDLADRHETVHPQVHDQAALVVVDDARLDDLPGVEAPCIARHLRSRPARRAAARDGMALRRLRLEDVDEDLVPDRQPGRASSPSRGPRRLISSRLETTPSLFPPKSTRISSGSMRTTVPSTTSPCLRLLTSFDGRRGAAPWSSARTRPPAQARGGLRFGGRLAAAAIGSGSGRPPVRAAGFRLSRHRLGLGLRLRARGRPPVRRQARQRSGHRLQARWRSGLLDDLISLVASLRGGGHLRRGFRGVRLLGRNGDRLGLGRGSG